MTTMTRFGNSNGCCAPRTSGRRSAFPDVDQVFGDLLRAFPAIVPVNLAAPTAGWPALNVREDESGFTVEADVPGLTMENLDLTFEHGDLTIRGARTEATEDSDANFHRRERVTGSFERTIRLGAEIDSQKVDATLEHGVLRVTLPKAEASRTRKIPVRTK